MSGSIREHFPGTSFEIGVCKEHGAEMDQLALCHAQCYTAAILLFQCTFGELFSHRYNKHCLRFHTRHWGNSRDWKVSPQLWSLLLTGAPEKEAEGCMHKVTALKENTVAQRDRE